jgi:hypothetical protein
MTNENIAGYAGYMFFHEGVFAGKKFYPVRSKNMFQFQPVNPGGIGNLYIIVVIIVIVLVYNPDTERI